MHILSALYRLIMGLSLRRYLNILNHEASIFTCYNPMSILMIDVYMITLILLD